MRLAVVWILALIVAGLASAHEVRPAYLEVAQTDEDAFDVTWKQPVLDGRRLSLTPVFPDECTAASEVRRARSPGVVLETWSIDGCTLQNGDISINGLDRTLTDVFVRIGFANGDVRSGVLKPAARTLALSGPPGSAARAYLRIGVDHILFGVDHLLFVVGLVLLVSVRQVLPTLTAFTVAHSLTLAAVAIGGVSLPGRPVEILIAASIVFLAVEVVRKQRGEQSLAARQPWLVAFGIGLVHGCGFAGALADIGLPKGQELLALLLFNIGVEIGQILFVCVLLGMLWLVSRLGHSRRMMLETVAVHGVGAIGAFWVIERVIG